MIKPIELKQVSFSYDGTQEVVKRVSFSVDKGSYTTLIGHNGSGKSTIAKLIIGLLEKQAGDILIDGEALSVESISAIRRKVGIVFQNPDNQFIGASVRDDVAFGLENHQVDPKEMDAIIEDYAQRVSMEAYLNAEPSRLSGGQKQRVAIAGILAMNPDILILDEATSMLDPEGKEDINALVQRLHAQRKMTILSITHDVEEVLRSDHVLVMYDGEIVMDGTPSEVMLNEDVMKKLKLDVPYSVKLAKALAKYGVMIQNPTNIDDMLEELCQLRLKK
jgi:energy-coupling factor transport system ATP-binding protein